MQAALYVEPGLADWSETRLPVQARWRKDERSRKGLVTVLIRGTAAGVGPGGAALGPCLG